MEQRGLRVMESNKTFFSKITNTLTKMLIPTKVGINNLMITIKRNALLKAYENYTDDEETDDRKDVLLKRYEESFSLYLEAIDKYIMDSIYKKVKNNTATAFEENALSKYYTITHLKETQYIEYKYRKQKYLLELDYETVMTSNKEKTINRYKKFYVEKLDGLYKGILKNYSIQLADNVTIGEKTKNEIFDNIFSTVEEYIVNILPIKLELDNQNTYKEILQDYDKFNEFQVGKLDKRDDIEKKMIILGISRKLFTHSLPLVVAEQCYIQLLKQTRALIISSPNTVKQEKVYQMLINLIEDYNLKLLSTKIYWDKPKEREEYKKFWDNYKSLEKITDKKEYEKQKEILFIKSDLKAVYVNEKKYRSIINLYKRRLVELGAMRQIKNSVKTINGNYTKKVKKNVTA